MPRAVMMDRCATEVISPACIDCMPAVSERMPLSRLPAFFATEYAAIRMTALPK